MTDSFDPLIELPLSEAYKLKDLDALHDIIEKHCSRNTLDIIAWILNQISCSPSTYPSGFYEFAKSHVQKLLDLLKPEEFLLVVLGELEQSESINVLSFSINFIESCALSIGLSKTDEIRNLLTVIRSNLHKFLLSNRKSNIYKADGIFTTTIKNIGNMLLALYSQEGYELCLNKYKDEILYYFVEPLQFIDINADSLSIFLTFLLVLKKEIPAIYPLCYEIYDESFLSADDGFDPPKFTDSCMALLFIWNLCLSNECFKSFLPRVFTMYYKYEVLVYMSVPFVQKLADKMAKGSPLSLIDTKQLVNVQEGLMRNVSSVKPCYPSTWWRKPVISLINNLESICKYPITSSKLPAEVKNCILTIEAFLSAATITSRCRVFSGIIERSTNPLHSGFRSHMIVTFKNFLHSMLSPLEDRAPQEQKCGESEVTLPYDLAYLRQICDLIFLFPLPECKESLVNQLGWLNAALSLAYYILCRYNAVKSGDFDERTQTVTHDIALALLRPTEKGKWTLNVKFLEPLDDELATVANTYRRAKSEYESNPHPSVISPNAPTEKECDLNLTSLRMLSLNLSGVNSLLEKLVL